MRSGTLIGGGRLEGADRERALDELVGLIRVQLGRAQADPLLGEDSLQRIERRSASLPQAESGAIAKELADIRVRLPLRRAQVCLDQARKEYQDGHRAEAWKNLEFARTAVAKAREAGQRARADELTGEIEKVEKDVDAMRDVGGLIVTVTGADGSPAAKVDMAVWGRELGATPRVDSPRYWSGCTDARGMCRVPLSGGTLLVEARVPSISGPTAEPVFTAPPRMEVKSPATSTARVELRLQRGAVVCVRLCGPDGEPRPRDNLTFRHKTLDFTARAKVSRDGSNDYWAGPLPPGTYSIAVQVNMGGVVQDAPPSAGSIEVTVAAGERKDIDVRLKDLPRASHSQR